MEKIIFFGLVIPILGFVLYLGVTAIMKGFSAKNTNKAESNGSKARGGNQAKQCPSELKSIST